MISKETFGLTFTLGGYKWLKYVPNGILKTAQAAEWKLQAWMIGKPPTLAYEGIGYNVERSVSAQVKPAPNRANGNLSVIYPSHAEGRPRPSMGSFSEYDDLGDFEGRFESRSTLGVGARPQYSRTGSENKISTTGKRKTSRGFLERLKGGSSSPQPASPTDDKPNSGKRLKALRSMGSLKGKTPSAAPSSYHGSKKVEPSSPTLPQFEVGLGFEDMKWTKSTSSETSSTRGEFSSTPDRISPSIHALYTRAGGRRSISFSSPRSSPLSRPESPAPSTLNSPYITTGPGSAYQATLGNALIAASHAESAKGTHNDLLQILNHENHSWGFSYSAYPHKVRVWYGDKDEKIAENAVRWMERNMGEGRCSVKVVKGADHALMYKSSVVVEVLERVKGHWRNGQSNSYCQVDYLLMSDR